MHVLSKLEITPLCLIFICFFMMKDLMILISVMFVGIGSCSNLKEERCVKTL